MKLLKTNYFKQKSWWRNLDSVVIHYRHMGEDNCMTFCHMSNKCRLDRLGDYSKVFIWR